MLFNLIFVLHVHAMSVDLESGAFIVDHRGRQESLHTHHEEVAVGIDTPCLYYHSDGSAGKGVFISAAAKRGRTALDENSSAKRFQPFGRRSIEARFRRDETI